MPIRSRREFLLAAAAAAVGPCGAAAQGEEVAVSPPRAGSAVEPTKDERALSRDIGQMLMMGFWGADSRSQDVLNIARWLREGLIGGVIFFEDNLPSPDAARALIELFAEAAQPHRPFFAVDQEGGSVVRLKAARGFVPLPAAATMARVPPSDAEAIYARAAIQMNSIGLNLNFGPVVDLALNPRNPIIGRLGRSYSGDPATVLTYATAFIKAHRDNHVLTALKHFPGHGSSGIDSHKSLPDITKAWEQVELQPFETLIARGPVDMVMVGHLVHHDLTGTVPASLSRKAVQNLLREDLGYRGVVVSDDMQMGALRNTYSPDDCIRRGLEAGLDFFVYSNREYADAQMPDRFHRVVRAMVKESRVHSSRIKESVQRLESVKQGFDPRGVRVVR